MLRYLAISALGIMVSLAALTPVLAGVTPP
jgi:hypothetical protein